MALRDQLNNAVKDAMKARDQKRLGTLRLVQAALKDRDIANRTEDSREGISDDDILGLFAKLIKSREDSIALYEKGGRPELAAAERDEIAVIREFMPQQMDETEAKTAIAGVITEVGAASMKDMGKVMAVLKERFAGKMDFSKASASVKELLAAPKLTLPPSV
ncbi:MAG: GatB/YqeY domain-containing protein [Rhizomicrobium sp.]